ncbi:uncharacterized protein LOC126106504 isoform X1 [Schistocerca cancellata]|uniref:uncharacterized protein LOC126106504 isoform X1 n=1 Tax=Schistocerca cancellata TaxID=274614 RepID=UPI002119ADC4|nr:uncharacterized protein LOC126106504 isoform X1 [Schistocerca cancellata]XP_049768780.1 uncharacterized protein LOC126106504 isoform X1 [Schistocerca cancellata]XP_049768781.1 uncharacterized protein LOC126106504 isoform X1 [Schistocerca cancellata]
MSNARGLQVVGIAPGHLGKSSRDDFPLMSFLRKQNLFAGSAESDNAEEPEPLPDAAELKRQNDERLEKILREARIQLQQQRSCAWQDPKSGEGTTGGSKLSGSGNLVLSGKDNKDTKLVEKPTEAGGKTNSGSESQPAQVDDGEKAKSQGQQKGLGSDPTVSRQNALERLRRMEWQRNKTETVRTQVELHALPPKRDLAAEEADAASEDARGKSKGRNRRRCRQQQQQQQQQVGDRPQLVVASQPPPFPGVSSRSSDVTPFWRASKSSQEDDRTPFPTRVNVWLQRPGVDLFPKQPVSDSELQKADELASATEEKMIKMAVEASLKTAEEEGTILLPQPPRCTKSTFVQPPPLENEDWEADIADGADSERNTAEKLSKNATEKQAFQQKVEVSDKNSEKSFLETKSNTETVPSASKECTDHSSVSNTVNYSRRVPRNDNHSSSWYQSSTKERTIRSKGDGKTRISLYMEEKASEKVVQWKKPIQESELSTDSHLKNSADRFQPEPVNNKKTTGIYNESQVAPKEIVNKERWRSDWKDRRNDFNEKLSNQNSVTGRKPEEANGMYIADGSSSTDRQTPKEQRSESKRRNRQGSLQSLENDSVQNADKDSEGIGNDTSTSKYTNVRSMYFRNSTPSVTANISRGNSRNSEESSVGDGTEGNLLNSSQNSFQSSFTNVCSKSANNTDFPISSAAHEQTDSNVPVNVTERAAVWNAKTGNSSHQYEEKVHQEQNNSSGKLQQQGQVLKQEEAAEKKYNRDCTNARVQVSSPPGLPCREQQRNEQVSRDLVSAAKQTSESKPPEQESSVDEFFRKYAQHNSTSGQAVRLPDGSLPMGAFRIGGSAPGLGIQPNCAQAPVIQGAAGVPTIHPTQIRVCGVPQMYQPCGMLPDMGTALPYSTYTYVDGTSQRPLLENHAMLQNNSDCCPSAAPQVSSRFGGNNSERPTVVPVTLSSQSPEGAYPSFGSCTFEGGQQAFNGNHLGSLLKNGGMTGYGNMAAAAASSLMPVEVMMPGMGTSQPTGVPPPPGVFAYPAVTPLTGVSPPRCSQIQQGLVLQPMQVPQENIGDRQVTPRQENAAASSVQDARGSQVYSSATQAIPQVPQASGVSQNTQIASGNGQTPASQESSHTVLNRSTKPQVPPANTGNSNPPTMYTSVQPNDMNTFLTLHQNGIADSPDVTAIGMSQWPLCCFSQTDLTQLQGMPQIMNADGTVSHFPDMAQFGMQQSFKQPGTPLVDHIWYPGVPPLLPVHDGVNMCRNNQTKQFSNVPDMRLDAQAAMVPQMRGTHTPQMSQFGPESQQLNEHSQIYFPGIGHIAAQTQLSTPSANTVGHSSVPPGLPPQPPFPQGTVQQQIGFTQHPPGILHTGMCQNANSLATAGNSQRNASGQPGTAAVPKGRIASESTIGDGSSSDSKNVQKMPRAQSSQGQNSQEGRYPFPGDGSRVDVSYLAEKLRQSSQRGAAQGMQTTATPQGTFQSVPALQGSTPKAQLYYEKVQSLLCQPPEVVSRLLQQMHLNAGVAPVADPSAGPAVGPQGYVVPPTAEVWPVVHSAQVVQERLHPSQSQGGYTVAARGRGKGRGRLRDVDG